MDSFNFGNSSKSGGFMSRLEEAWGNSSHPYSRSFSVTLFPICGAHCREEWSIFVNSSSQFLHCSDTCFTWNSIYHDGSLEIVSKDCHLLDLRLSPSIYFWLWEIWISPPVGLWFQFRFEVSNPRSIDSVSLTQEWLCLLFSSWIFMSSVQHPSSERSIAQEFFSCLNSFSEYTVLRKAPHLKLDDFQGYLPQVSHFVYLLMFSTLQVLDHRLCSHDYQKNDKPNEKLYYGPLQTP